MREAEIKHGRMCMLAWSGYVMVDLGYTFPGAKYQGVSSFDAHDATAEGVLADTVTCVPPLLPLRAPCIAS